MQATLEKRCLAGYLDKAKQRHKIRMEIRVEALCTCLLVSSLISILLTLAAFVSTLTATLDEKCFGRLLGQNKGRRRAGSSQLGGEKSRIETDCLFSCLAPFGRPAPCIFAYASSPQFSMHCGSITYNLIFVIFTCQSSLAEVRNRIGTE